MIGADPTLRYLRAMARNNAWSNDRVLTACESLTVDELDAERSGFYPSIMLTLNHILVVDWYYLDALESGGLGARAYADATPCATLDALRGAQSGADRRLVDFVDGLDASAIGVPVSLERGDGRVVEAVMDRVLAHLFMHQIHHRGQVHAMLAGTRVVPPQIDEFLLTGDPSLRASELEALGISESDTW